VSTWEALQQLLDRRQEIGTTVSFWWRDDDAGEVGAALQRLLQVADRHRVPLALAVIPTQAGGDLSRLLDRATDVWVLQHGYSHTNHAPIGEKRQELWHRRDPSVTNRELLEGAVRLRSVAGSRALPVLVPPWNRLAPALADRLAELGYAGLSTFSGPCEALAPPAVRQVNCHLDPIDWRQRGFVGRASAISQLIGVLEQRADSPVGLLTHHRDHDAGLWVFIDELLARTTAHPAVRWLSAPEVFASPPASGARSA
jgi:hypothetical protein